MSRRSSFVTVSSFVVVSASAIALGLSSQASAQMMGRRAERAGAFLESRECALCHSSSPRARALTDANGNDVSPVATWSATTMANAFRDPYWRAQMSMEIERDPARRDSIEAVCTRCHAPAANHQSRLDGTALLPVATPDEASTSLTSSALARDGVTCTVCHQAQPGNLGKAESFSGMLDIRDAKTIFGPFADPATGPMNMHTGYTPTHGAHISSSALCGACHTLYTHAAEGTRPFLEQGPYLEWRNSVFSDEPKTTPESRSCQQCHMPDAGAMRIARNPMGLDFNIATREPVRTHAFVGGNAFMLDLLRENAEALGVTAAPDALTRMAAATRAQLSHRTARIDVTGLRRTSTGIEFDVTVENLSGHKLPSGYPSRRAWLQVDVRAGRDTVFSSGAVTDGFRLAGVADELGLPHRDRITSPSEVAIYEMVAVDAKGRPTTSLADMVERRKDSRLLPRGWRADGPHADETRPVGIGDDRNFVGGRDTVTYAISLPPDAARGALMVIARLQYQAIPTAWADGLRASQTRESRTFLQMYDKATNAPETLALTVATVGQ